MVMNTEKPTLCISRDLLSVAQNHAQHQYPYEACGFLLGHVRDNSTSVHVIVPAANVAAPETRKRAYHIDPRHWMRTEQQASRQGLTIVGIYHSHPDAEPMLSQTDIDALWPNLIYLIVSSGPGRQDSRMAWTLNNTSGNPEACDISLLDS